jgi:antitoxin component YwqK of YwqJK toxin-antitoxin module
VDDEGRIRQRIPLLYGDRDGIALEFDAEGNIVVERHYRRGALLNEGPPQK